MNVAARSSIRPLDDADVAALYKLRLENRRFFEPFEPRREDPDEGWSLPSIAGMVRRDAAAADEDRAYAFGIFEGETLVGRVVLSNVVRSAWQNASLGYYVGRAWNGRGHATTAVELAVRRAFDDLGLHRVQAAVMPRNVASRRVVEKVGFRHEGFSPRYLQIAGVWEDHDVFAITAD